MLYLWVCSFHSFCISKEMSCSDSQRSVGHKRSSSNHSQGSSGSGGYVPSISVRGLGGGRGLGVIAEVEKRTEQSKPARVEFIERLTEIFSNSLPNHYRLGQAHFSRTLFTVCEKCRLLLSLSTCLTPSFPLSLSLSLSHSFGFTNFPFSCYFSVLLSLKSNTSFSVYIRMPQSSRAVSFI